MAKVLNQFWFEEGSICKIGASLKDYINDKGSWKLLDEYKILRFYNDGRSFPQKFLEEELGDVLYYVFAACMELEIHPEDLMYKNRNKLRERYATTQTNPPNCS